MASPATGNQPGTIAELLIAMRDRLETIPEGRPDLGEFLATYLRTTVAVGEALDANVFLDPAWVERWDLNFAGFYLRALEAYLSPTGAPTRPWRLAFDTAPTAPPLIRVLLGINAHINYDLPQALLAVISDEEFRDPARLAQRRRDHERIDGILASRVAAEDTSISARSARTLLDRALRPVNRWASRKFLKEAREKVWNNALELSRARTSGEEELLARLDELEVLTAAKVTDLLAPGQVLLRLSITGFGVALPPPR